MQQQVNRPALEPRPQSTRREVRLARPAQQLTMWREGDRFSIELSGDRGDGTSEAFLQLCVPVRRAHVLDRVVAVIDGAGASTAIAMNRAELAIAADLLAGGEG